MRSIETTVEMSMEDAEQAVRAALAEQGFGIITEIDFAATLKSKLGVRRDALKVLGACNPGFAHQALELDPSVALVLPCNVSLSPAQGGGTRVQVVDPRELVPDPAFAEIANDAAAQLQAAVDSLSDAGTHRVD